MRASRLYVVARAWLEDEGLAHLLPDPHGPEEIHGLIDANYMGGADAFLADADRNRGFSAPVVIPATADGPSVTWFRPPETPIIRTCARAWCAREFSTRKVHQRFCSLGCKEGWAPAERPTIDELLGTAA
jgi:hypothetical protein